MTPEVQFFPAQNEERKLKLMLRASIVEDVLLLHCSGRVTFCDEADVLLAKVCVLMPHTRQLVLDLSGVHKMDCAGLGALAVIVKQAREYQCAFKLVAPDYIRILLEVTNLDLVLEVHSSPEEAMLAFAAQVA